MTSSTLAGERRWASARRGGMTVLGKVAVPKPLNLPSQRLENHGLDPTVEIVPKGSLSWGSRSSSTATNPWGSSLSPTPDSSSNSPNHLSGRPSSGGSGTRPSTAGSDRPVEPTNNVWGPNSRPSSASGVLASNQSSLTSLRPHSAEARPASSQLSRFAEPVSESPGAWGGSGTAERLGVVSSKKDEFSLSSGDFPTLGTESKDQGSNSRPSSASGRVPHTKDKTATTHADDTSGAVNPGPRGSSQNVGDAVQPCMEKWQGEPQQYFNPNVPPQHFDAWRGPPMNAPVWYGGPPGPPPYGAPVGPGGFPVEPFPYYRPQIPPPAFANSQPVPPPRGGPRGHHPNSGNAFRPQIPDAYVRPGMQFRPGFYPAPMAFDGYYNRPPMGYCNSNERDAPFMGMGAGPSVYDRYPSQNASDPNDSYARAGGPGPTGKTMSGDVESAHSGDSRGSYKVLLKHHNDWDEKEQGEKRVHMPPANAPPPVKGEKPGVTSRKYEWGAEDNEEEDIYSSPYFENRGGYVSDAVQAKSSQSSGSIKQVDGGLIASESVTLSSQMSQASTGRGPALLSTPKDATLMRRIEGLNAKVRASDERVDYASNAKVNADISPSGYSAPTSQQVVLSGGDKMAQPIAAMSRRPYNDMPSRNDHHGKGRFSNQDADGWRKRPVSASKMEPIFTVQERDQHQSVKAAGIIPPAKDEGQSVMDLHDSTDSHAQRAKMKELVKERAIRLQKEEEERIREQKAKALAKLEELDRRMQSGDASNQAAKKPLESGTPQKEARDTEPIESATKFEASSLDLPLKIEVASRINENSGDQIVGSAIPSEALRIETLKTMKLETVPLKEEVVIASATEGKSALQLNEGGATRHKRTSYKQKLSTTMKSLNEKSISDNASEVQNTSVDKSINDSASTVVASSGINSSNQPNLPNNSSMVSESSAPQRRKYNKGSKNKNKQDGAPPIATSTENVPSESIPPSTSDENVKSQASNVDLNTGSIRRVVNNESGVEPSEHRPSLPSEEAHGRVNNQWKPHQPRRMPRNQQVNRFVDKFHANDAVIWAPVQSQNKAENKVEAAVEGDPKPSAISVTPMKSDNLVQNSAKSKRAEIERYVPKPVAKELAQHVDLQHPVSSSGSISTPDETATQQPFCPATGQSKEDFTNSNKHGKLHGAWRQRGSTEFSNAKNVQQGSSSTSDTNKGSQEATLKNQPFDLEVKSVEAEKKSSSVLLNASDSRNSSRSSDVPAPDIFPVSKDQGVTGKGKSHPNRGLRNVGNSHNIDNTKVRSVQADRTHIQSHAPDINQSDSSVASKENHGTGEHIPSHWQPKSHAHSAGGQKGSTISGSQNVGLETSRVVKKDYPRHERVKTPPQHDSGSNEIDVPQHDQSISQNKVFTEVPKASNHEPRRERKFNSSKGRPHSSNQNPDGADESAPAVRTHTQHQQQQPVSAGSRRYGNQMKPFGRGHESLGDWSGQDNMPSDRPWSGHDNRQHNVPTDRPWSGQDNRQHNMPMDRDRPRSGQYNRQHNMPMDRERPRSGHDNRQHNMPMDRERPRSGQDNRHHNTPMDRDRQGHSSHYEYQPVGSYNNTKQGDGSQYAGSRYREKGRSHPKRGGGNFREQQSSTIHVDADAGWE